MDINFSLVSEDGGISSDIEDNISSADEDELLNYEELSDLSGDEFLDDDIYEGLPSSIDMDEEPEQSGMSAELRQQFALCISSLQQPFQPCNSMDPPAANVVEDSFSNEPQELIFSDEDLIVIDPPSTADAPTAASAADAPAAAPAADAPENPLGTDSPADMPPAVAPLTNDPPADIPAAAAPLTSVRTEDNSAVMLMDEDTLAKMFEGLPPPLEATLERYRKRQATPEMKAHVMSIRAKKIHLGEDNHKLFLPFNLRDKLIAMRDRKLAEGPYINRKMLIDEYKLKQQRKQWEQTGSSCNMN